MAICKKNCCVRVVTGCAITSEAKINGNFENHDILTFYLLYQMCFIISLMWLQKFIQDPILYAFFGWTTLYGYRNNGKLLKWMSKCKVAGSKKVCIKITCVCEKLFFILPFQVKILRNQLTKQCASSIEGLWIGLIIWLSLIHI